MSQNQSRRAAIILGIFMAVVLVGGVFLQIFQSTIPATGPTVDPTAIPTPTFPPPVTSFDSITFDQQYLHPSGMYAIGLPTGFTVSSPSNARGLAQVNLSNEGTLSVIDAYVEDPGIPVTADDLSGRFTQETLAASWSRFNRWSELSRRRDGDQLLIDFEVTFNRQIYAARQRVWTDGEWIYVVRVLTPDNATNYLRYLLDGVSGAITPFKQFAGTPFEWNAYYDILNNSIIRYPGTWTLTDSAPGRPASIQGPSGEALRVETRPGVTVEDEAAAEAIVLAERSTATILSVAPAERGSLSGYAVAYRYTTADGEPFSGYALLLNSETGLQMANLRFPADGVDLNSVDPLDVIALRRAATAMAAGTLAVEATDEPEGAAAGDGTASDANLMLYGDYALIAYTFGELPVINFDPSLLPPPTATPIPTDEPTATNTPEPTATHTATHTATNTATHTATFTPTNTPTDEPTATNTPEPTATHTATNTATNTATQTNTPRPTRTPRPTLEPTAEPTPGS